MKLKKIETPGTAHYAYVLADGGEAAIVDPCRDVDQYLEAARQMGARVRYVIETHRQEDFVMGSRAVRERTGAKIVNGTHEIMSHGDVHLDDGQHVTLGSLKIVARHTPGHTPESMCWIVYPDQHDKSAWAAFTGDTLFFGDTGRSDIPDQSKAVENAGERRQTRQISLGLGCCFHRLLGFHQIGDGDGRAGILVDQIWQEPDARFGKDSAILRDS